MAWRQRLSAYANRVKDEEREGTVSAPPGTISPESTPVVPLVLAQSGYLARVRGKHSSTSATTPRPAESPSEAISAPQPTLAAGASAHQEPPGPPPTFTAIASSPSPQSSTTHTSVASSSTPRSTALGISLGTQQSANRFVFDKSRPVTPPPARPLQGPARPAPKSVIDLTFDEDDEPQEVTETLGTLYEYPVPPDLGPIRAVPRNGSTRTTSAESTFWSVYTNARDYDDWVREVAREPTEVPTLPRSLHYHGPEMAFAHATTYVRYVHSARRAVALRTQRSHDVRALDAAEKLLHDFEGFLSNVEGESRGNASSSEADEPSRPRKRARAE